MATQNAVIQGSYWYNANERLRAQLLKNKNELFRGGAANGADIAAIHKSNVAHLWNQLKQNPSSNNIVFDRYDLYAMILYVINFNDANDRRALFELLLTNQNARRYILGNNDGAQENFELDGEVEKYVNESGLIANASQQILKTFIQNEKFAREFFLFALPAAEYFSPQVLLQIMLENPIAAMAIVQNIPYAKKLLDITFSPNQIIQLFAKKTDPHSDGKMDNPAYYAALLNFFLNYRREDLNASGLLDKLNAADQKGWALNEIAAVNHLRGLLYGGQYNRELATTIANDQQLVTQLYLNPQLPSRIASITASLRYPLAFLQRYDAEITGAHIMHALPTTLPPRVTQSDVEDYLKFARKGQTTTAMRLKEAVDLHVQNAAANSGNNRALLALVKNDGVHDLIQFSKENAVAWIQSSKHHSTICRHFAQQTGFVDSLTDDQKTEATKSPYLKAADNLSKGIAATDGGWFFQHVANYCTSFVTDQKLDQGQCFLIASRKDLWANIDVPTHHITFLGIKLWERDADTVKQERDALAKKSPFFASKYYRRSLAALALWDFYQPYFIAAFQKPGKEVLLLETLLSVKKDQLRNLYKIKEFKEVVVALIATDSFAQLPHHVQTKVRNIFAPAPALVAAAAVLDEKGDEPVAAGNDVSSTESPEAVDEPRVSHNPFEDAVDAAFSIAAAASSIPVARAAADSTIDSKSFGLAPELRVTAFGSAADLPGLLGPNGMPRPDLSAFHSVESAAEAVQMVPSPLRPSSAFSAEAVPVASPASSTASPSGEASADAKAATGSSAAIAAGLSPAQDSTASPGAASTGSPGANSTASPAGSTSSPVRSTTSPAGSTASPAVGGAEQYQPLIAPPPAAAPAVAAALSGPGDAQPEFYDAHVPLIS